MTGSAGQGWVAPLQRTIGPGDGWADEIRGEVLEAAGWREVKNVSEGFEGPLDERFRRGMLGGRRRAGLPWEQR